MAKDYKELYEERAAIIEFDGGKSRKMAEEDALIYVTNLFIRNKIRYEKCRNLRQN